MWVDCVAAFQAAYTHFTLAHACMEAYIIPTHRTLSAMHPVCKPVQAPGPLCHVELAPLMLCSKLLCPMHLCPVRQADS